MFYFSYCPDITLFLVVLAGEKKQFIDCQLFVLCGMGSTLVILLWISTLVDWHVANWMFKQQHQVKRRLLLMLTITTNLGTLGYFKYDEFLLDN